MNILIALGSTNVGLAYWLRLKGQLLFCKLYIVIAKRETFYKGQSNLVTGDIARLLSISFLSCRIMSCHMVMASILDLIETDIAPFDPPTIKTLKWIGRPVAKKWPFEIRHIRRGAFRTPFFFWGGVIGSLIVLFERVKLVSYRISIVTIALSLSLTIRPQFAIECLRRSNQ